MSSVDNKADFEVEWSKIRYELEESKTISSVKKIAAWMALDCPDPPVSAYKQELVKNYARHSGASVLIETGTFLGSMVEACLGSFDEIHSIELSPELHQRAVKKFKGQRRVKLHQGDSGELLKDIVKKLRKPAIFWLDAHYSSGETAKGDLNTPIEKELRTIFSKWRKQQVILIDDARLFNGQDDYPTIAKLKKIIAREQPSLQLFIHHDVIRIQADDFLIDI